MKKVMLMLLAAVAIPAFAADVTITATPNGDGTITIGYEGAGAGVRGIALKVTATEGAVTGAVDGASTFNVFMDAAFVVQTDGDDQTNYDIGDGDSIANPDGPGTIALPAAVVSLSAGYVDQGETQAPAPDSGVVDTITVAEGTCITIELDELRGGVVGDAVDNVILPTEPVCDGGGDVCAGDVTGTKDGMELDASWNLVWTGNLDAPNKEVNLTDLAAVVNILVNEGGAGYSVTDPAKVAQFKTADVTGVADGMELDASWNLVWTGNLDAPNDAINLTDLAAVVNILVNEGGAEYKAACPW